VTLGAHGYFWLRIRNAASVPTSPLTTALPVIVPEPRRGELVE
jgi:maltose alpha-D-glucosyltransferase/alpha-amylase